MTEETQQALLTLLERRESWKNLQYYVSQTRLEQPVSFMLKKIDKQIEEIAQKLL